MKIQEKIIIVCGILFIGGTIFMSYRNFVIAREANHIARAEANYLIANVPAWNATYLWAQTGAKVGLLPSDKDIQAKLPATPPVK